MRPPTSHLQLVVLFVLSPKMEIGNVYNIVYAPLIAHTHMCTCIHACMHAHTQTNIQTHTIHTHPGCLPKQPDVKLPPGPCVLYFEPSLLDKFWWGYSYCAKLRCATKYFSEVILVFQIQEQEVYLAGENLQYAHVSHF